MEQSQAEAPWRFSGLRCTDSGSHIAQVSGDLIYFLQMKKLPIYMMESFQLEKIALPQFDTKKEDIEHGNCTKYYEGTGYYTYVEVIFTLRRQMGFYMMGVYVPTLLIVVLSWLSFWINPEGAARWLPWALDVCLLACLCFGFASLVDAVVQVMLNNPKRVEAEKARITKAEHADGKGGNEAKKNTVNGPGTPVHISTLQVGEIRCKKVCISKSDLRSNDFSI
ncbi:hypothetical protein HPG69_013444, partial [Diceros bicornis minor]